MVQFVDSYDPPVKGLHDDLNFVSPRIGEVRAVTTIQLAELFYVLTPRILDFSHLHFSVVSQQFFCLQVPTTCAVL